MGYMGWSTLRLVYSLALTFIERQGIAGVLVYELSEEEKDLGE